MDESVFISIVGSCKDSSCPVGKYSVDVRDECAALRAELAYLNGAAVLHPTRDHRDQTGVMRHFWCRAAAPMRIGFDGNTLALADT